MKQKLDFKCPNPECGKLFSEALSWFKGNKRFTRPFCHIEAAIDFEKLPNLKAALKDRGKP